MKKLRRILSGLMLVVSVGTGVMIVHGEENTALEVTELSQF